MIDLFQNYRAEVRVEQQFLIPCDFSNFISSYRFTYVLGKDLNNWLYENVYKEFSFRCETISLPLPYKYYKRYQYITIPEPQIEFYKLCNPRILFKNKSAAVLYKMLWVNI